MKLKKYVGSNPWVWPLLGIVILWIGISIMNGGFSFNSLFDNISLSCFLVIMALGQSIVITRGEGAIDLSLTYVISFVPYFITLIQIHTGSYLIGLLFGLLACAAIGMANGCVNYYLKVPGMITTLAMGYIVYSMTMLISQKQVSGAPNDTFKVVIQTGRIAGIPVRIILTLLIIIACWFVINRTTFGWQLRAVGMNRTAAVFAGINVPKIVIGAFVMTGVLIFLASIMLNAYLGMGGQTIGNAYLLPCVAAAVLGGTNLNGGKTNIAGVVIASIMWTMLNAFLNVALIQLHLNSAVKNVVQGVILVLILIVAVPNKQINE